MHGSPMLTKPSATPELPLPVRKDKRPPKLAFTVNDLADLLGKKPQTVRTALWERPWTLPACVKVPDTKGPLFLYEDVETFLRKYRIEPAQKTVKPRKTGGKRGRPTKASQEAKQTAQG